ncbi:zinc finger mynd-type protein [Pyrenophora teres f. maculata]|nr:zinc finger mynd-type protein [Pyrenophora teres f. maculata]
MDTTESDTVVVPPLSSPQDHLCFTCKQPATKCCSRCLNARYCSATCQEKDWKTHMLVCKSFATLEPRPGPNFFRGIFFPPNEPLARFVWIEYGSAENWTTIQPHKVTGDIMRGHFQPGVWPLERPASHTLGIYHTDRYLIDGSLPTPSITKAIGASGIYFRGPFLAHGHEDDKMDEDDEVEEFGRPCDLDTADLSYLLGFFQVRGEKLRRGNDLHGIFP